MEVDPGLNLLGTCINVKCDGDDRASNGLKTRTINGNTVDAVAARVCIDDGTCGPAAFIDIVGPGVNETY